LGCGLGFGCGVEFVGGWWVGIGRRDVVFTGQLILSGNAGLFIGRLSA
jgi:hypothetical protein